MSDRVYRIFIINPGSTSTKLSLFENRKNVFTTDVFHDSSVLLTFPTINDQLEYRMKVIHEFLEEDHIDMRGIDAVVGRGGGCYAVPGGIYEVDEKLIEDTRALKGGLYHASMLGVQMAAEIRMQPSFMLSRLSAASSPTLIPVWNIRINPSPLISCSFQRWSTII